MIEKDKEVCNNSDMVYHNYKKAFTLAEVLITLGIIGVVAALTMPMLIGHFEKITTATKLKKFYSVMAQATDKAMSENEDWSTWDYSLSAKDFFNKYYASNLKVVKIMCKYSNRDFQECGNNSSFNNTGRYMFLEDGTVFTLSKGDTNTIASFYLGIYPKGYQKKVIGGRTYFRLGLYNLKDMKHRCNYTPRMCGFQGDGEYNGADPAYSYYANRSDSASCSFKRGDPVWGSYECYYKFIKDGFVFKDDYYFFKTLN